MKNIILIVAVFFFTASYAQKKDNSITESTFKVDGVCGMCEKRIEEAALRTKGVKLADWNKESKDLKVVYNSDKVDLTVIKAAVSGGGHDTPETKADSSSYAKLPDCCRYREGAKCGH